MTIWLSKEDLSLRSLDMPAADRVQLAYLAMLIRPFSLQREAIHYEKVVMSLLHFASTESQQVMSRQLTKMWETVPVARMHMFASEAGRELIPGGTSDGEVADRVLYSQIAHADDASHLLDHIDSDTQLWSLAGMVGDWLAIVAHQQHVLRMVRSDLCPTVVEWPGNPRTIFERLGVDVRESTQAKLTLATADHTHR